MEEIGLTYTLICEKCGNPYYSSVAFPSPQICSVCFKPAGDALPQYAKEAGYGTASRLLTDEELCPNIAETEALRKQDAKTASIKDAEWRKELHRQVEKRAKLRDACQKRVERIKREIESRRNNCRYTEPGSIV